VIPRGYSPCFHDKGLLLLSVDDKHKLEDLSKIIGCDIAHKTIGTTIAAYHKNNKVINRTPIFTTHPYSKHWGNDAKINELRVLSGATPEQACEGCYLELKCEIAGGIGSWGESLVEGLSDLCPVTSFAWKKITARELKKAKLWPFSQKSYFDPNQRWEYAMGEEDAAENRRRALAICHLEGEELIEASNGWFDGYGGFVAKAPLRDMCFDRENVITNQVISKIIGHHAGVRSAMARAFRKRECEKCAYTCEWVQIDRTEKCHITPEEIIADIEVNDSMIRWMAQFAFTDRVILGKREAFVWGPQSDGFLVKGLSPPFNDVGIRRGTELFGDDYLFKLEKQVSLIKGIADLEDGKLLRYMWWALDWLHRNLRWDVHIAKNNGGDRMSRNDILGIELRGSDIIIHSDTRASSHGNMQYRGDSITVDERPRYESCIPRPYYEVLNDKFKETPGARLNVRV
jgi:hypothetical protein